MMIKKLSGVFVLACILAVPNAEAAVKKSERDLILITHLDPSEDGEFWNAVYTFIENNGVSSAKRHLSDQYREIHVIQTKRSDTKKKATMAKVVTLLDTVTKRKKTKAVDMLWMTHGLSRGRIQLQRKKQGDDPNVTLSVKNKLAEKIRSTLSNRQRAKLRALHSTACYGASAMEGWIHAGFKVVSGGRRVYADAASSQPKFLKAWKAGKSFKKSIAAANESQERDWWDKQVAKLSRYKDRYEVDSYRKMKGQRCININTTPSKVCK